MVNNNENLMKWGRKYNPIKPYFIAVSKSKVGKRTLKVLKKA